jgi:hypothetical protein
MLNDLLVIHCGLWCLLTRCPWKDSNVLMPIKPCNQWKESLREPYGSSCGCFHVEWLKVYISTPPLTGCQVCCRFLPGFTQYPSTPGWSEESTVGCPWMDFPKLQSEQYFFVEIVYPCGSCPPGGWNPQYIRRKLGDAGSILVAGGIQRQMLASVLP